MEVEKVKNQSLTKSKQSVELDADHFAEVESRLALQPGEGKLMLGNRSSGSRGSGDPPNPKPEDDPPPTPEELEAEAYKKAVGSLKKAIQALSSSLDKGAVLKESLASLPNVSDATVQTHLACLDAGLKKYGQAKAAWLKKLGAYPSQAKPGEGSSAVAQLGEQKALCEADLKALNKSWAPLKLWARNEGI